MILHCETAGVRLDVFLTQALEGMTRSAAQRLLEMCIRDRSVSGSRVRARSCSLSAGYARPPEDCL